MLYSIMCIDSWGDVFVCATRETYEAAEDYATHLNDTDEDHHWVSVVEDDSGTGAYLESGYNGEAEFSKQTKGKLK